MRPIDTNVLLRVVTGDPPDQADRARRLVTDAAPQSLLLMDVIVAELVYVLSRIYGRSRDDIVPLIGAVLGTRSIRTDDAGVLRRTLELYAQRRMDWADAYLIATAEARGLKAVVSFDRFDGRLTGLSVQRQEP